METQMSLKKTRLIIILLAVLGLCTPFENKASAQGSAQAKIRQSSPSGSRAGVSGGGGAPEHASVQQVVDGFATGGADMAQNWASQAFYKLVAKTETGFLTDSRLNRILQQAGIKSASQAAVLVYKATIRVKTKGDCYDNSSNVVPASAKINDIGGEICMSAPLLAQKVPGDRWGMIKELLGQIVHEVLHQAGIENEADVHYVQKYIVAAGNNLILMGAIRILEAARKDLSELNRILNQGDSLRICKLLGRIAKNSARADDHLWQASIIENNIDGRDDSLGLFKITGANGLIAKAEHLADPLAQSCELPFNQSMLTQLTELNHFVNKLYKMAKIYPSPSGPYPSLGWRYPIITD